MKKFIIFLCFLLAITLVSSPLFASSSVGLASSGLFGTSGTLNLDSLFTDGKTHYFTYIKTDSENNLYLIEYYYLSDNDPYYHLVKLTNSGNLDTSFGDYKMMSEEQTGIAAVSYSVQDSSSGSTTIIEIIPSYLLLEESNNRIYVAGTTVNNDSMYSHNDIAILAYDLDGSIDTSFGTDALITFNASTTSNYSDDNLVKLEKVGDYFVALSYGDPNPSDSDSDASSIFVTTFKSDGTVVDSEQINGIRKKTRIYSTDTAKDMVIVNDSDIYVLGHTEKSSSNYYMVAKLTLDSSGNLSKNTSFSTNGVETYSYDSYYPNPLAINATQEGDVYFLAYNIVLTESAFVSYLNIAKITDNGSLDSSFNAGEIKSNVISGIHMLSPPSTLYIKKDSSSTNKLYIPLSGINTTDNSLLMGINAFNENGDLDTSFNDEGSTPGYYHETISSSSLNVIATSMLDNDTFYFLYKTDSDIYKISKYILTESTTDDSSGSTGDSDGTGDGSSTPDTCTEPYTYYADSDNDGYGDPNTSTQACSAPANYVANRADCDDSSKSINPAQTDICDNLDNNCNGEIDENDICSSGNDSGNSGETDDNLTGIDPISGVGVDGTNEADSSSGGGCSLRI